MMFLPFLRLAIFPPTAAALELDSWFPFVDEEATEAKLFWLQSLLSG
jgi:hypothetical protein